MIGVRQRYIEKNHGDLTQVCDAFSDDPPANNGVFWKRFDEMFRDMNVHCGFIGLTVPTSHWVVVSRDTRRRVWFLDSNANAPECRKNVATLFARDRRRSRNQWRISRGELLVFSEETGGVC